MRKFFDFLCIYLLILINKSYLVVLYKEVLTIIVFIILVGYIILFKIKLRIDYKDLLNTVILFTMMLGQIFITNYSLDVLTVIRYLMVFVITYIVINCVENFKEKFIYIVSFLSFFSLIFFSLQLLGQSNIIEKFALSYSNYNYGSGGLLYVFGNKLHLDRNCGIFPEPGVYQIVLNYALLLLLFYEVSLNAKVKKCIIILIAGTIISSLSTAGIILLSVQFITWLIRIKKLNITYILLLLVLLCAIYPFIKPYTIDKFQYNEITGRFENASSEVRFQDIITDYKIFKDNVLGVGYTKYHDIFLSYREGIGSRDNSSSGITSLFSIFGVFFATLYIFVIIYNIFSADIKKENKLVLLAFYLIIGITQPSVFLPLMIGMFFSSNKHIFTNENVSEIVFN